MIDIMEFFGFGILFGQITCHLFFVYFMMSTRLFLLCANFKTLLIVDDVA